MPPVADGHPAKIAYETLHLPHTLEPPPNGSVCRVIDYPSDATWKGKARVEQSLDQACSHFSVYSQRKRLNGKVPFA